MLNFGLPRKLATENHSILGITHFKLPLAEVLAFGHVKRVVCFGVAIVLLVWPAHAIQSHPAPEGLYVHQLAHVCFVISMGFLSYWLGVHHFCRKKGWRYIQVSAILFACWNIFAFLGHWVEEKIPRELFLGDPDWSQRLVASENLWADLFYLLKLDHLVSVPAIVCLFIGIKLLYRDAEEEEEPQ